MNAAMNIFRTTPLICWAMMLFSSAQVVWGKSKNHRTKPNDIYHSSAMKVAKEVHYTKKEVQRMHDEVLKEKYPRANACATCHPTHYQQWSMSMHAYGQYSPVFGGMQRAQGMKGGGTQGDFCFRCHSPIGGQLGESPHISNLNRSAIAVEGVTCIVCHRAETGMGHVSARFGFREGDFLAPNDGPTGEQASREWFKKRGKDFDEEAHKINTNFDLESSRFCESCHNVFGENGVQLESANEKYKNSPAASENITCQDCHMVKDPTKPKSYTYGAAAVVEGGEGLTKSRRRKLTDHTFAGPDFSVVNPTIFPQNLRKDELNRENNWNEENWLAFNYRAGWGAPEWERKWKVVAKKLREAKQDPDEYFLSPWVENMQDKSKKTWRKEGWGAPWTDRENREKAFQVVQQNLNKLYIYDYKRRQILRAGLEIGNIYDQSKSADGDLKFMVEMLNITKGHDVPTGFIAERPFWMHVQVRDSRGKLVYESGNLDYNGDYRDTHSSRALYKHTGLDPDLTTLQSYFRINYNRGGSEFGGVLAYNIHFNVGPYLRPQVTRSEHFTRRAAGIRIQHRSIPANTLFYERPMRKAYYTVSKEKLEGTQGPYKVTARIMAGMVPVNLVYAIDKVENDWGDKIIFDYLMSPAEIGRRLVNGVWAPWNYYDYPGLNPYIAGKLGIETRSSWESEKLASWPGCCDKLPEGIGGMKELDECSTKLRGPGGVKIYDCQQN